MKEQLEQTVLPNPFSETQQEGESETSTSVLVPPVTDADVLTYLRHSYKFGEIAALAKRDAIVLASCQKFGITVSDEEWQAAGDTFRQERKLWGTEETFAWLKKQQINAEEWSEGIRLSLLEKKLKEHLFGATVDSVYVANRNNYRRIALSQILVVDLATANKIVQELREGRSFCALALEHSKGKQSRQNGGFVGICYFVELLPEITEAISNAKEGEIIGPVQTKLGYHIIRVEKYFPLELNQEVKEQVMESLFQAWLENLNDSEHDG